VIGYRRLSDWADNHFQRTALLVGILGGVVNVAIDFDHLWKPSRSWHIPLGVIAGIIAVYCIARIRGLCCKSRLLRGQNNEATI